MSILVDPEKSSRFLGVFQSSYEEPTLLRIFCGKCSEFVERFEDSAVEYWCHQCERTFTSPFRAQFDLNLSKDESAIRMWVSDWLALPYDSVEVKVDIK